MSGPPAGSSSELSYVSHIVLATGNLKTLMINHLGNISIDCLCHAQFDPVRGLLSLCAHPIGGIELSCGSEVVCHETSSAIDNANIATGKLHAPESL